MSDKLKYLLEAAMALDLKERAELAGRLLDTLDEERDVDLAEIDAAQIAEIERRLADSDEQKLIPLDEAMRMAKARRLP